GGGTTTTTQYTVTDTLTKIDTQTDTVTTVNLGHSPTGIVLSPDGSKAYIGNFDGMSVSVVDTASLTEITSIPVGLGPRAIAISPDGTLVYALNQDDDNVSIIDTASNTVIKTIDVGDIPMDAAVTPDGQNVYVIGGGTGSVSVINLSSTSNATPTLGVYMQGPPNISTGTTYYRVYTDDPDGDNVTVTSITNPEHGSLTSIGNDVYGYAPDFGYYGSQPAGSTDHFAVTVDDGRGGIVTQQISIPIVMPETSSAVVSVPVGDVTAPAASGNDGVYVVQSQYNETTNQQGFALTFVDSATHTASSVTSLPGYYDHTLVGGDGRVYLGGDDVAVFDPATQQLTVYTVNNSVVNFVLNDDESKLYAITENNDFTDSQLAVIDFDSDTTSYVDIPDRPNYYPANQFRPVVSNDGNTVYVLQQNGETSSHSVAVIDTQTGDVESVDGAGESNGMALTPDGGHLYVTSNKPNDDNGGLIKIIDTSTLDSTFLDVGWGVDQVVVNPDTGEAYVSAFQYFPDQGIDRDAILVAGPSSTSATVINTQGFMYDLAFSPDGQTLYGATYIDIDPESDYIATISAIDTDTHAIRSIRIPDGPSKFVVSPDGSTGYATIGLFDPATGSYGPSTVAFIPLADASLTV
ncbi:MAG: large repetitive protein, partial [Mycobacterium sp.]|nr:large repetitive protein [Mycobacterium sp.]